MKTLFLNAFILSALFSVSAEAGKTIPMEDICGPECAVCPHKQPPIEMPPLTRLTHEDKKKCRKQATRRIRRGTGKKMITDENGNTKFIRVFGAQ